jgi:hypothetical protein
MGPGYDIIGDLHGQADLLVALLKKMDYRKWNGAWRHPERQAIFVGDFIDRGPKQIETVMTVRRMIDAGSALAVMGNHEFNAVAWYLPDPAAPGDYLRSHFDPKRGSGNRHQHAAFLAEVEHDSELHRELVEWFLTLPLRLDLPHLRIVHACWHSRLMDYLEPMLSPGWVLTRALMVDACRKPSAEKESEPAAPTIFKAVDAILKGIELAFPEGVEFIDEDGIKRGRVRSRWWDSQAITYRSAAMVEDSLLQQLPELPTPINSRLVRPADKPLFIGHYSLTGPPRLLASDFTCLDYSAGNGGPLCAYRWEGESILDAKQHRAVFP